MTGRGFPVSFVSLALSLLVFGFFTPVPALLAYPLSLLIAVTVGGLSACLGGRSSRRGRDRGSCAGREAA